MRACTTGSGALAPSPINPITIKICKYGLVPYRQALELQASWQYKVAQGQHPGVIMVLEHPNVITMGRNATKANLRVSLGLLNERGIDLVYTDRGGQITAHMPGQLVVYPILPLAVLGLGVRALVTGLEQAVIACLAELGLTTHTDPDHPGVWTASNNKICAIGVRVKQRVSMHGLALNVSNTNGLFDLIVPCGIVGRGVTSVNAELGAQVSCANVAPVLVRCICQSLGIDSCEDGGHT